MTIDYAVKSRCYAAQTKIAPKYVIVHSTACAIGTAVEQRRRWNNATASVCAHGAVDSKEAILTLPLNVKGWHVGANGNGKTVGFEIVEPSNIKYTTSNHTVVDTARYAPEDNRADFEARWENAVSFAAELLQKTGLDTAHLIGHAEAYKLGIATNHGDPTHWFRVFGKTMDDFRAAVKAQMTGQPINASTADEQPYRVRVTASVLNVRAGASTSYKVTTTVRRGDVYTITAESGGWGHLKSGAGWICLKYTEKV